jgi:hypothetical protein
MARRGFEALELEMQGERAQALKRVAEGMEKALDDLRRCDAGQLEADRAELVAIAAERVWFYVVQRESLGWFHHDQALRSYGVTEELYLKMGPRRT